MLQLKQGFSPRKFEYYACNLERDDAYGTNIRSRYEAKTNINLYKNQRFILPRVISYLYVLTEYMDYTLRIMQKIFEWKCFITKRTNLFVIYS